MRFRRRKGCGGWGGGERTKKLTVRGGCGARDRARVVRGERRRREIYKRTVESTWVLARWGARGNLRCAANVSLLEEELTAQLPNFEWATGQAERETLARARVCQSLKTRNWNPLPREPCRPQIARANTFVSDRPQFASLHCACARPRATRVRETHLYTRIRKKDIYDSIAWKNIPLGFASNTGLACSGGNLGYCMCSNFANLRKLKQSWNRRHFVSLNINYRLMKQ